MPRPSFPSLLSSVPVPEGGPVTLRVTGSAESKLRRGHPWLYAEQIRSESRAGAPGDLAVVFDRKRNFLAVGLYDPHSPIRLRVLRARKSGPIDDAFFTERFAAALARRAPLAATNTDAYRMVHGESDGLPGFIADRYGDSAVVKLYSHAWVPWLLPALNALFAQQPIERVVLRLSRQLSERPEALSGLHDGQLLLGELPEEPLTYLENGLRFEVDLIRGQKTGSFLDQRDNRARIEQLARGQSVLNVFSYTGGFSLAAARGGAHTVTSLDQSGPALAASVRNFALNASDENIAAAQHHTREGDAFAVMRELEQEGQTFDLIIVDPPAFARRKAQVEGALQAYGRLTGLALRLLKPGGQLLLASCSKPIDAAAFQETVCAAARAAHRPLREIEETGHALDHPTDFAESHYLKGIYARA
ncbi:MAG: 23S rRNA (cytosine1962-C5)-methyltransferase [Pseudohongiellaceae bacterium]|jgi:23S rRNA (cytosine1962-C5)-methyltransferase